MARGNRVSVREAFVDVTTLPLKKLRALAREYVRATKTIEQRGGKTYLHVLRVG